MVARVIDTSHLHSTKGPVGLLMEVAKELEVRGKTEQELAQFASLHKSTKEMDLHLKAANVYAECAALCTQMAGNHLHRVERLDASVGSRPADMTSQESCERKAARATDGVCSDRDGSRDHT